MGEKLASSCCRDVGELLLPSCVGELLLPSCVGELLLPLCGSIREVDVNVHAEEVEQSMRAMSSFVIYTSCVSCVNC